jgi:hypothetical protein
MIDGRQDSAVLAASVFTVMVSITGDCAAVNGLHQTE